MKPIQNKIIVKITKEQWNSLFVKKIKRNDGTYVDLFTNVAAQDGDDRRYTLNIQTGEVVAVSDTLDDIKVGDTAILDYLVSTNNEGNLIEKNEDFELRCINAVTTYYEQDDIAYANRKSNRDQIIARKGEYKEISPVLGIIRGDQVIARPPYVFLHHESNLITKVGAGGIIYEEEEMVYEREVMASGSDYIKVGETLVLRDHDVFPVKCGEMKFDCIFSRDVLAKKTEIDKALKNIVI